MDLKNKDWSGIAFGLAAAVLKTLVVGGASMAAGAVFTKLMPAPSLQEAWNGEPKQIPETSEVPTTFAEVDINEET